MGFVLGMGVKGGPMNPKRPQKKANFISQYLSLPAGTLTYRESQIYNCFGLVDSMIGFSLCSLFLLRYFSFDPFKKIKFRTSLHLNLQYISIVIGKQFAIVPNHHNTEVLVTVHNICAIFIHLHT